MSDSKKPGTHPVSGPSPTVQSDRQHTDINAMTGKYLRSRMAGNLAGRRPMFIEVPAMSYHEMLTKVTEVQQAFRSIPARIRSRFHNDPGTMIAWLHNPDNRREGVKMGLIDDPEMLAQIQKDDEAAYLANRRKTLRAELGLAPDGQTSILDGQEGAEALRADPEAQPPPPNRGVKKPS